VHSIAIVAENTDYGRGGAEAMRVRAKAFGLDVTSTNYYTQGTNDFSSLLAGIKSQRPDRIVYWGLGADDANFARQFAQNFQGSGTLLSGRPQLAGPDLPIVQSGALEKATTVAQYDSHINTPANKKFVAAYTKEYGAAPIIQSFEGYQEVMLAAAAIKAAKSASPAAIRNALAKIKFQSMMAPAKQATLHFDKYQQAHDRAAISMARGGKVVLQALLST
jgi:branched-chain amino acid transport system substrate-binding protein